MGTFICRGYFSNCQALPRVLLTGACWFVLACGLGLPLLGLASLLVIINPSHFDRRCTATSYGFHAMLGRGFLCCSVWVTRTRAWQWGLGLRFADERETRTAFHFSQHCPSFRARRERIVKKYTVGKKKQGADQICKARTLGVERERHEKPTSVRFHSTCSIIIIVTMPPPIPSSSFSQPSSGVKVNASAAPNISTLPAVPPRTHHMEKAPKREHEGPLILPLACRMPAPEARYCVDLAQWNTLSGAWHCATGKIRGRPLARNPPFPSYRSPAPGSPCPACML